MRRIVNKSVSVNKIMLFRWVFSVPIRTGKKVIPMPSIKHMFAILLPIMSPKETSGTPCEIAEIATDVSGSEVPMAIMVAPIIRGEILIFDEKLSTNFNNRFEENIRPSKETINIG